MGAIWQTSPASLVMLPPAPGAPVAAAAGVVDVNVPDLTIPVLLVLAYLWLRK